MIATDIDRSLAYTALLSLDPAFARLPMQTGGVYVSALVEAWLAQDAEKNLWDFSRKFLRPRIRCASIGCRNPAVVTLVYSFPESRETEERDYCCRGCAAGYVRRQALKGRLVEGGRPWYNMNF